METEICGTCGKKRWERIGEDAYQCACDCAEVLEMLIQVEVQQSDLQAAILALLDTADRKDGGETDSLQHVTVHELREIAERLCSAQPAVLTGVGAAS